LFVIVTNGNSQKHSAKVLGHTGELCKAFNSSVEFLDHWRQSVSFDVPGKLIIWERRTVQFVIVATCVLGISQFVTMF